MNMKPQPTAGGHTAELESQITELNAQLREMEENRVLIVGHNDALRSQNEKLLEALEILLRRSASLDHSVTHDGLANCEAIAFARSALALARGRE